MWHMKPTLNFLAFNFHSDESAHDESFQRKLPDFRNHCLDLHCHFPLNFWVRVWNASFCYYLSLTLSKIPPNYLFISIWKKVLPLKKLYSHNFENANTSSLEDLSLSQRWVDSVYFTGNVKVFPWYFQTLESVRMDNDGFLSCSP